MQIKSHYTLILLLAALLAGGILVFFPKWTVDDAYIYYRYAENFATTGELKWNFGQPPVEGYTGIFWLLLLSLFIRADVSPIVAGHLLGVAAYYVGLVMLFFLLRRLKIGPIGVATGLAGYIACPLLFTHMFSGLETMLYLGLILAAALQLLIILESDAEKQLRNSGFLLTLLIVSLVRPEGIVLSGLFLLAALFSIYQKSRRSAGWWLVQSTLLLIIPLAGYFWWRFSYYGQLFSNTFYNKTGGGFALAGPLEIARFLIKFCGPLILASAILLAANADMLLQMFKGRKFIKQPWVSLIISYTVFLLILVFQYSRSHLTMNYAYRFYLPFFPLFWVVVAASFDRGFMALRFAQRARPAAYVALSSLVVALCVYQLCFYAIKFKDEVRFASDYKTMLEHEHVAIGKLLKAKLPPNEWAVSYIDAGAVPYYSQLNTLDFGGLNDLFLSRRELTQKEKIDYFYSVNPGAAVFTSESLEHLKNDADAVVLTSDPRFKKYILWKKFHSTLSKPSDYYNYYQFIYIREDLVKNMGQL